MTIANQVITSANAYQLRKRVILNVKGPQLALSPDGDHVALAAWPNDRNLMAPESGLDWKASVGIHSRAGKESRLLPLTHAGPSWISQICYNLDGEFLAYADVDGIYLYETRYCDLIWKKSYFQATSPAPSLQFASGESDEMLLIGGFPGVFRVGLKPWDEFAQVRLDDFSDSKICVSFSADGTKIAAWWNSQYSANPPAGVWDMQTGLREIAIGPVDEVAATAVAFHPTKNLIASAHGSRVRILDLSSGSCCAEFRLPKGSASYRLNFGPDGTTLLVDYQGGSEVRWIGDEPDYDLWFRAELWDWEWGAQLWSAKEDDDGPVEPIFSPDGRELAMVSNEGTEVWVVPAHEGAASEPSVFVPDYDSQGRPYGHPQFEDD